MFFHQATDFSRDDTRFTAATLTFEGLNILLDLANPASRRLRQIAAQDQPWLNDLRHRVDYQEWYPVPDRANAANSPTMQLNSWRSSPASSIKTPGSDLGFQPDQKYMARSGQGTRTMRLMVFVSDRRDLCFRMFRNSEASL
jgi:hypothetical protein